MQIKPALVRQRLNEAGSDSRMIDRGKRLMTAQGTSKEQAIAAQFRRIEDVVEMMHLALKGICESEESSERRYHLKNFVLHCSSVTHVTQGLKSKVKEFDGWWATVAASMQGDLLMRYFSKLRTEILKKNAYHVGYRIAPRPPQLLVTLRLSEIGTPPIAGMTFEITGDGPLWVLRSPAGREIKTIRAELPDSWGGAGQLVFMNCPEAEFPQQFEGQDISHICTEYQTRLLSIVDKAYEKYWPWPDQMAAVAKEFEAEK